MKLVFFCLFSKYYDEIFYGLDILIYFGNIKVSEVLFKSEK